MAGRGLSLHGRIAAAGASVAVAGALLGLMAASDHHADASKTTTIPATASDTGNARNATSATPYGRASAGAQPQPHTRTGAS